MAGMFYQSYVSLVVLPVSVILRTSRLNARRVVRVNGESFMILSNSSAVYRRFKVARLDLPGDKLTE